MQMVGYLVLGIITFVLCLMGFNHLMGYRKCHIRIDFNERYTIFEQYIRAIKQELESQGREVEYQGNYEFLIDGSSYIFIERNVPIGGVPVQRTILKPVNKRGE